jgi:hypothetical protein
VAQALSQIVDPQVLMPPMKAFHVQLQVPLRQALTDLGEPEPEARERALARVRRLIGGNLQLPPSTPVPPVT